MMLPLAMLLCWRRRPAAAAALPRERRRSSAEPPTPADVGELEALDDAQSRRSQGMGAARPGVLDRNDYPRALDAFQRAVKAGPESAEAHNWLGVALAEKSDLPGAIAEFRKADRARSAVRARVLEPRLDARAERRLRRGGEGVQEGAGAGAEQRRRAPESRHGASGDGRSRRRARTSAARSRRPTRTTRPCSTRSARRWVRAETSAARSRRTSGRSRSIRRCARAITRLATR